MRILAHCYTYGNNSASGADKMLQSLLEYLAVRNCECRAVIDNCATPYILNSVQISSNKSMLGEQYDWCDIVIIHLVALHEAVTIAARFSKPVIHICHNQHFKPVRGYIVYNSYHLRKVSQLPFPSIVVHPPTKPAFDQSHFNQPYITLVNTCDNKGGSLLIGLAKQLPQFKFLGVHGGYDKMQMYQPIRNLQYRPYSAAGMDYSDTRILIVPSKTESWSLCAAEAMARGIPVLCSDLPGLRENCGDAAIYCNSMKDYVDAIWKLLNADEYEKQANECRIRFMLHNYDDELNNFYNFIENIVSMNTHQATVSEAIEKGYIDKPGKDLQFLNEPSYKKEKAKAAAPKPKEKKEYKGLPTQK